MLRIEPPEITRRTHHMREREQRSRPEYAAAFSAWLRGDDGAQKDLVPDHGIAQERPRGLTPIQGGTGQDLLYERTIRALNTQDGSAGAFLVPEGMQRTIVQAMSEISTRPLRRVATVQPTDAGADYTIITSSDSASGRRLNENTTLTQTDPTVGRRTFRHWTYSSDLVLVPLQLLEVMADIDTWLAVILGERIGRAQNTDFTLGSGVDQPQGVATAAAVGINAGTGQTTTVLWDDLLRLQDTVASPHRFAEGAAYMAHSDTISSIKRLTDSSGRALLQNGQRNGRRVDLIDGFPLYPNDDLPVMAASARSILFGNLSQYIVRDVADISVMRLSERYAEVLQVGFFAFARSDGMLLDPGANAVALYVNSAT